MDKPADGLFPARSIPAVPGCGLVAGRFRKGALSFVDDGHAIEGGGELNGVLEIRPGVDYQ
jgi:hypothetical protein